MILSFTQMMFCGAFFTHLGKKLAKNEYFFMIKKGKKTNIINVPCDLNSLIRKQVFNAPCDSNETDINK